MKPKDIFSLAIRLLGLFFIYMAARDVQLALSAGPVAFIFRVLLAMAIYVGIGWWLLGGAPLLVQRAYPDERADVPGANETTDGKPE